jgi:hypothetical protein
MTVDQYKKNMLQSPTTLQILELFLAVAAIFQIKNFALRLLFAELPNLLQCAPVCCSHFHGHRLGKSFPGGGRGGGLLPLNIKGTVFEFLYHSVLCSDTNVLWKYVEIKSFSLTRSQHLVKIIFGKLNIILNLMFEYVKKELHGFVDILLLFHLSCDSVPAIYIARLIMYWFNFIGPPKTIHLISQSLSLWCLPPTGKL